jgi:hypothetical protein
MVLDTLGSKAAVMEVPYGIAISGIEGKIRQGTSEKRVIVHGDIPFIYTDSEYSISIE